VIHARGLRRAFGRVLAVADISLDVPDGAILALLGPNGAGKTTTVRMLAGLLAPHGGTASVAGCDVGTDPVGVRARVGLMTDVPGLYDQMTPVAYLDFFGRVYGLDAATRASRIDQFLSLFDLQAHKRERMAGFSRGMQQKMALSRALLHQPAALFLDEPTAGLDPLATRAVRELILGLKHARRSIVLCTHDLDEAERLADVVMILRQGRIVAADSPGALRAGATRDTLVRVDLAAPCPAAPAVAAAVAGVSGPSLADGSARDHAGLLFRTAQPELTNPRVVADLVAAGAQIVSVTYVSRTLEDVYATAVDGATTLGPATAPASAPQVAADPPSPTAPAPVSAATPGDAAMIGLIAARAAVEALRDRMTLAMSVFFAVVLPVGLLLLINGPLRSGASANGDLGGTLAFYLLVIGLLPAASAVGIASGQFAGEKERGVLTPLLASPASNLAIFAGKILGAVIPPLLYSVVAEVVYLGGLAVVLGPGGLGALPPALSATMILLVPAATCFAAIVASLVSSRVRTYNAAQQIGGLLLIPLWAALFALAAKLADWGIAGLVGAVAGLVLLDAALTVAAAATWRREEVLSQR